MAAVLRGDTLTVRGLWRELIESLTLTYNKVRQASITNEILEVVAGAESLR